MNLLDRFRRLRLAQKGWNQQEQQISLAMNSNDATSDKEISDLTYHLETNTLPSAYLYRGLNFEQNVIKKLNSDDYGFLIKHCGKTGDEGIDFRGSWRPAGIGTVIGQCKFTEKSVSVRYIRELEGTFSGLDKNLQKSAISILASNSMLSKAARMRLHSSSVPMIFVRMPESFICVFDLNERALKVTENVSFVYSVTNAKGGQREVVVIKKR